ncbi:prepilin peptidase [Massilia forsythiae]|uniref:prepilin peptidase n=1 Tax=Massilia forsythiae TaxID=2728020 RepID=UPI00351D7539
MLGGAYLLIPILLILLDTRTIADDLVYPLLWLGLLTNLNGFIAPLHDAVFSAFAAYMVLWTVNFLLEQLTRKSFIGNGLFKLAAAASAWTGWLAIPAALFALPAPFADAAPASVFASVGAGLVGLLIGSFLNVVVHRLPIMDQREIDNYIAYQAGTALPHQDRFDLMVPRSRCPHCGHQITALENIPIVSWLVLRGKCSQCKAPISPRYPIVEAVTGLLAAALVWHFGSGWLGLAALAFGCILVALTLIDYDTKTLPDVLTYPLLWLGLLVNLNGTLVPLRDAVIGAVAGYLFLWTVSRLYRMVRGQIGMGEGDFKLLAGFGAWFGWSMLPALILMSAGVGSVVGVALILFRRIRPEQQIPFGPYLAGAGIIALFYGTPVMRLLLGLTV